MHSNLAALMESLVAEADLHELPELGLEIAKVAYALGRLGPVPEGMGREAVLTAYERAKAEWGLFDQDEPIRLSGTDLDDFIAGLAPAEEGEGFLPIMAAQAFRRAAAERWLPNGDDFDPALAGEALDFIAFDAACGDDLIDLNCGTGGLLLLAVDRWLRRHQGNVGAALAVAALKLAGIEQDLTKALIANAALYVGMGEHFQGVTSGQGEIRAHACVVGRAVESRSGLAKAIQSVTASMKAKGRGVVIAPRPSRSVLFIGSQP